MGTLLFKNNASTTLSGAINDTQTTITVASGSGFPAQSGGDYFYATMYEVSAGVEINVEIIKVTAVSGSTWTIVRAQDGTTARTRNGITTCYVELRWTAASSALMLQKDNNLSDLASASTARTNLGLGSVATQDASNVNITGGSISGVTIASIDSTTTISDNIDGTKKLAFEVAGVSTGATRTLSAPNANGTIALTSDLAAYQPLDSDLTAFAALSASGLVARTGSGTVAVRAITQPAAGITVTNGDGVAGNPTLALANDLAAIEGLSTTGFVRRTASDTWSASALVDGDLPGALTGKTYNGLTLASAAIGFTVAGGTTSKTLTVNNTLALSGTDGTTITFPTTSGTLPLNNQTFFIGTTSVAINRTSGALSLTGVSIDGSAGSAASATSATTATNLASGVLGSLPYQSAAATTALLAPNTSTTRNFLRMTGTGTAGAAPAWDTVTKTDVGLSNVENTALSTWAGSANITTLGTVTTGTWSASTIGITRGGTGATTAVAAFDALSPATTLGDLIYSDGTDNVRLAGNTSTSRRFLRQTGTGTVSAAPAWDALVDGDIPATLTGKTYNGLTLTAAATGFTVAGGTTSKTLTVSNTLTLAGTDSSTLNIGAGGTLGSAAFTASTAYAPAAGSSSIVTVGVVASGTWQGSAIGISYGGTGATSKTAGYNALTPITTLGDLVYGDGANSATRLAGNTTSNKRFLTQTGTGTVSAAPGWNAIVDADVPSALTGKTYNGLTLTANATGFQVAGGTTSKTLVVSNNLTLAGTDGTTMTFPGTSATIARTDAAQTFTGAQTFSNDPTLSAGTANGVTYLNGSKVLTSGSALTFDGTTLSNTGAGDRAKFGTSTRNIYIAGDSGGVSLFDGAGQTGNGWYINGASSYVAGYIGSSEQMRLTTTGLGIGTSSPQAKLSVAGSNQTSSATYKGNIIIQQSGTAVAGTGGLELVADAANSGYGARIQSTYNGVSAYDLSFQLRNNSASWTQQMLLDSSGNLGLGVTPSAWGSSQRAAQISLQGLMFNPTSNTNSTLTHNAYYDGTNWRYIASSVAAARYEMTGASSPGSTHSWSVSAGGTAGNAISFTQAMTLDASGNLGVGTTSPGATLQIGGGSGLRQGLISGGGYDLVLGASGGAIFGFASQTISTVFNTASVPLGIGTSSAQPMLFGTNSTERARLTADGNQIDFQPAESAQNTSVTLTVANLQARVITSNAAVTLTLPTGTSLENYTTSMATNTAFEVTFIATTANAITIAANGNTTVGNLTVSGNTSGTFRFRKTATNTFTVYRVA